MGKIISFEEKRRGKQEPMNVDVYLARVEDTLEALEQGDLKGAVAHLRALVGEMRVVMTGGVL